MPVTRPGVGVTVSASEVEADVATQAELDAHTSATTSVHGITNTARVLEVASGATYSQRSTPAFSTVYTPSATRPTLVCASVSVDCDDSENGTIFLRIGSANPPTASIAQLSVNHNNDAVSAAARVVVTGTLTGIVPPGENYVLVTSTSSGSPTYAISQVRELTL